VNLEEGVKEDVKTGGAMELRKLIISLQDDRDRGLSTLPANLVAPQQQKISPQHKSKFLAKVSEIYRVGDPVHLLGTALLSPSWVDSNVSCYSPFPCRRGGGKVHLGEDRP